MGLTYEVLVEGRSKKSDKHLSGRTSQNKVVVFPAKDFVPGDYVNIIIKDFTLATLIGESI